MRTRLVNSNRTTTYIIAAVVIIVAFLLLGGGHWMSGMMSRHSSLGMSGWNWPQILVSLGLGFLLGILVTRRR
jgi:H+/Cl- antiporter ClcA